jgi:hypothetical protein
MRDPVITYRLGYRNKALSQQPTQEAPLTQGLPVSGHHAE